MWRTNALTNDSKRHFEVNINGAEPAFPRGLLERTVRWRLAHRFIITRIIYKTRTTPEAVNTEAETLLALAHANIMISRKREKYNL